MQRRSSLNREEHTNSVSRIICAIVASWTQGAFNLCCMNQDYEDKIDNAGNYTVVT